MGKNNDLYTNSEVIHIKQSLSNIGDLFYIVIALLTIVQTSYGSDGLKMAITSIITIAPTLCFFIMNYSLFSELWSEASPLGVKRKKILRNAVWSYFAVIVIAFLVLFVCAYGRFKYHYFFDLIKLSVFMTVGMVITRIVLVRTIIEGERK